MRPPGDLVVRAAVPGRWDDVVAVFGRRGSDPAWCWCRRFLAPPADQAERPRADRDNRAALQAEVADSDVAPGFVAYLDDRPVGWTRVGPRDGFAGVRGNRALARLLPADPDAWWVTCFAVDGAARGRGVGTALLGAAVEHARRHGAARVEGHPVDIRRSTGGRASPAAVFTGTLAQFTTVGFHEVGRTYPTRPVVRLELTP